MRNFMDKYLLKITVLLGVFVLILVGVLLIKKSNLKTSIKSYKSDYYSLSYDNTWKLSKKEDNKIVFKHEQGEINIDIIELNNNKKYEKLLTIIDDVISSLNEQNKDYNLIGKENTKVTKKQLDGYKLLYEKDNMQALVYIVKVNDKLILFRYEASSDYFDILLDSAQNIIYNFELNKYETKYELVDEIANKKINYKGDIKVDKTKEYEIANNHYDVKYTIPNDTYISSFQSTFGIHYLEKNNKRIIITTSIIPYNLYQFFESNDSNSLKNKIETLEKYGNATDLVSETSKGYDENSYISMLRYNKKKSKVEKLFYVYPLDNSHIFMYEIEATDIEISEELVKSLKVVSKERYSQNIELNYEGDYVVNDMKLLYYSKDKYAAVKIYTPKELKERDLNSNIYSYRYFGKNYNEEKGTYETTYDYNISSSYNSCKMDIERIKSSNSSKSNYTISTIETKNFNGYNYEIVDVKYEENNRNIYEKHLRTALKEKVCLDILIKDTKQIDENLEKITKVDVKELSFEQ